MNTDSLERIFQSFNSGSGGVPSDRANVSLTRLLMPSSSDVVAVRTVPPSVSRNSFSSCTGKHQKYKDHTTLKC